MTRKHPQPPPASRWPILVTTAGFFLAEVAVLGGAASPFRLPKEAVALAALCAALGLAVVSAARRRTLTLPRGRLPLVLMALPALQLVSAGWSASPPRSVESALLTFIWVIWVSVGTFRAWQSGQAVLFDVVWSALRASIVLMVLGFYLR